MKTRLIITLMYFLLASCQTGHENIKQVVSKTEVVKKNTVTKTVLLLKLNQIYNRKLLFFEWNEFKILLDLTHFSEYALNLSHFSLSIDSANLNKEILKGNFPIKLNDFIINNNEKMSKYLISKLLRGGSCQVLNQITKEYYESVIIEEVSSFDADRVYFKCGNDLIFVMITRVW